MISDKTSEGGGGRRSRVRGGGGKEVSKKNVHSMI